MDGIEMDEFSERWAPYAVAVLRIVTALLFIEHGTTRLFGVPDTGAVMPATWSLVWVTGWLEIILSLALLVGAWTRWAGFLLAAEQVIIYFYVNSGQSMDPMVNGGEAAILFTFIFILLGVIGPGEWSVDKVRARNRDHIVGYEAPGGERTYDS